TTCAHGPSSRNSGSPRSGAESPSCSTSERDDIGCSRVPCRGAEVSEARARIGSCLSSHGPPLLGVAVADVYLYADETGNLDFDGAAKQGGSAYFGFGTAMF